MYLWRIVLYGRVLQYFSFFYKNLCKPAPTFIPSINLPLPNVYLFMKYDSQKHHRRSIRLKGYDYTQAGAYFINICTWQRECLFGDIVDNEMQLSRYGETVRFNWHYLPKRYPHVILDAFVIMPNHVHGIIFLTENANNMHGVGTGLEIILDRKRNFYAQPAPTKSTIKRHGLSEVIRGFKTFSARRINQLRYMTDVPVWQRNYYERIIRNEESLQKIRQYIINNPSSWQQDKLYFDNLLSM